MSAGHQFGFESGSHTRSDRHDEILVELYLGERSEHQAAPPGEPDDADSRSGVDPADMHDVGRGDG
jgi:hypothetical protein